MVIFGKSGDNLDAYTLSVYLGDDLQARYKRVFLEHEEQSPFYKFNLEWASNES